MTTVVTGGKGQLGADLSAHAVALGREELDITDPASIAAALEEHSPDVVINCAAYHVVDRCEADPEPPWEVNVRAVRDLAMACAERGAKLVHFSTNYVFDGARAEPYGEGDVPAPRSVYAVTKLAGEHMALAYAPGALVIRSSGLYGRAGNTSKGGNFVERILAAAREHGELSVVADQRLQPTYTADLAPAVLEAVERDVAGVLHLTNTGACSWHGFTEAILERAGVDVPVAPTVTERRPGLAPRPLNGVLACPAADAAGLPPLRPWEDALGAYMAEAALISRLT